VKRFPEPEVAARFAAYPPAVRRKLLALRRLIFATAAKTQGVGMLEESLRWGEPAYLTTESGSGSTIRMDWKRARPDEYALYFNCRTGLVPSFRRRFSKILRFEGNRAIVFGARERLPVAAVSQCVAAALTHHLRRR